MMFKKCSNFYWFILRGFNFIKTVYELFDNPSYMYTKVILHICTEFVRKVETRKDPDETEVKQTCGGEPVSDLEIYIAKIWNLSVD